MTKQVKSKQRVADYGEVFTAEREVKAKFFHFMIGLKKITQHTTSKVYEFVPMQDFSKKWTDAELYKKYELTPEEIDYIESSVWTEKEVNKNDIVSKV